MKKTIISLLAFMLATASTFAAQDPAVKNPQVTPAPAIAGQAAQFSFQIGNNGNTSIPGTSTAQRMGFTLTLSSGVTPEPDGMAALTGTITNYFDITYNAALRMYTGTQKSNVPIPGLTWTTITINVMANAQPISAQVNIQPNPAAQAAGQATSNDLIDINTPLPVKLVSFSVIKEGNTAQLKWTTTEEVNSDHFEIQHSLDAKNWTTLQQVKSNGNSRQTNNYAFTHDNPEKGNNYYRLKMIDQDQTFAYSSIRSVHVELSQNIAIYPNPASDMIFLKSYLNIKSVTILDISGFKLIQSNFDVSTGIPVSELKSGIYLVKVLSEDGHEYNSKFAIQR